MSETMFLHGENACANVDPTIFFPVDDATLEAAKAVCRQCPVQIRRRCLQGAIVRDERSGVWGGVSAAERREMKRAAERALVKASA